MAGFASKNKGSVQDIQRHVTNVKNKLSSYVDQGVMSSDAAYDIASDMDAIEREVDSVCRGPATAARPSTTSTPGHGGGGTHMPLHGGGGPSSPGAAKARAMRAHVLGAICDATLDILGY